jgi:methylmalonyl-CoA epimerase
VIKRIDHVGLVVRDLDKALDLYVNTLGFEASKILVADKGDKFRTVMVSLGQTTFELIEPIDPKGGIQSFLETRGEGIHHVSLEVDDIREEVGRLKPKGVRFLMREPEEVMGDLVTFIHPKSTRGVLMEVVQRGENPQTAREEQMSKTVVLVASLDTKSVESKFVKDLLENWGVKVVTIDLGTGFRGQPVFIPDFPAEEVAKSAGTSLAEVLSMGHETQDDTAFMGKMIAGATAIAGRLYAEGQLDGIFSLGGTAGTHMATAVMRSLPFGVPKVMVSTAASGDVRSWVGTKDIVMVPSVADIVGLNRITRNSLRKAAGALRGMVFAEDEAPSDKPLIAVTTLGGTTETAMRFKAKLEEKGFEVVVFHAIGIGGRTMEDLVREGKIQGVFDMSTNEVIDHLYGGMTDGGPDRLEVAGEMGLPYLVGPGNLDHLIFTSREGIPEQFRNRKVFSHGTRIHIMRSRKTEMAELGKVMAEKLNKAKGPTAVIFPLKGFSFANLHVDKEEFEDPVSDRLLLDTLRNNLRPDIKVIVCDCHINDEEFANAAAATYTGLHADKRAQS